MAVFNKREAVPTRRAEVEVVHIAATVSRTGKAFAAVGGTEIIDTCPSLGVIVPGRPDFDGHLRQRTDQTIGQINIVAVGIAVVAIACLRTIVAQIHLAVRDGGQAGVIDQSPISTADTIRNNDAVTITEAITVDQARLAIQDDNR